MRSFFLFLFRYRAFLVLIILESASMYLVVQNSNYNHAKFFNSTNLLVGSILEASSNINDFIDLRNTNEQLITENAKLRTQINAFQDYLIKSGALDSVERFSYINAHIVYNSVSLLNNTLTINGGAKEGIEPGMGVIGNGGIVGKIKRVGNKYATVVSFLDIDVSVSAEIVDKINLCIVQWDGKSPMIAKILFVPRHYKIAIGDTVVTSGYNAIYPKGVVIGTISNVNLTSDATFYDAELKLINDFTNLLHVQVIVNKDLPQIDSLLLTTEE